MTYLAAEFVLSPVWEAVVENFFNVTKVTVSSRLIIVLGKDEFSFANVSVFLVEGGRARREPPRDEHPLIICFRLWTTRFHLQLNWFHSELIYFF